MWGSEVRLLQPFLLLLIYERPSHGYDLIERLAGMGVLGVEPGHAYRVLRGLERERLLTSRWVPSDAGPARRLYELTPAGAADLKNRMEALTDFGSVVDAFLSLWAKASRTPGRPTTGKPDPAVAFSRL
ncbi:PadR family transcriptional regulator [Mycobacterium tuberculosis]|nr:PadR family transcriptional regulator [Mycobacterium tuberculosis]